MKVAVPLFGTRVSPRLDCGTVLLVAQVDETGVGSKDEVVDAAGNPLRRVARLRELGVETVVCGAVTGFLLRHMTANGIQVFPWVSGEASEVLEALAHGELAATPFREPGNGRRHCGRRRRGRGGPRWPV